MRPWIVRPRARVTKPKRDHRAFFVLHQSWLEPLIVGLVFIVAMLILTAPGHCAEPEPGPSRVARYAFYGALHGADVLSTEHALARGWHESNPAPFLQSTTGRVISKAIGTVILAESDLWLSRKRHKKTKWFVRVVAAGALGWATHHNMGARAR